MLRDLLPNDGLAALHLHSVCSFWTLVHGLGRHPLTCILLNEVRLRIRFLQPPPTAQERLRELLSEEGITTSDYVAAHGVAIQCVIGFSQRLEDKTLMDWKRLKRSAMHPWC